MFETLRRYKEAIGYGILSAATGGLVLFGYLTGNKSDDLPFGVMFSLLAAGAAVGSAKNTYDTAMMSDLVESFSGVSEDLTRQAGIQVDVYHPGIQSDGFKFSPHPSSDINEAGELIFQ